MQLFKSGNPTLTEKMFDTTVINQEEAMTARGAINKFAFLFLMVIAGAGFTWHLYSQGKQETMMPLMITGVIGGLITALVIIFKRTWAPYLAPLYGLLQGLFLGAISAIVNNMFSESYPSIIIHAVYKQQDNLYLILSFHPPAVLSQTHVHLHVQKPSRHLPAFAL